MTELCPVCRRAFTEDDPGVDVYAWLDDYTTPVAVIHEACVLRMFDELSEPASTPAPQASA